LINLGDLLLDLHGSNLIAGDFFKNFDVAESKGYVSGNHTILETPKAASFVFISGNECIRFKLVAFVDRFLTGFYEVLFHKLGNQVYLPRPANSSGFPES
jgi:hypothetical protein